MIGYYVHHVGHGHANRAAAVITHLDEPVTVVSSLPRPTGWRHGWIVLPRDDESEHPDDPTAGGALHWVPRRDEGLARRMSALVRWLADEAPTVLVSDVSVEVVVLTRLMGIPVVTMAQPGRRDDDAHQSGYRLADAIIAPWPRLTEQMCVGLDAHAGKVHHVGGVSRFDGRTPCPPVASAHRSVLSLGGAGGEADPSERPRLTPGWRWTVRGPGRWIADPWPELCGADVVVAHCGLGALADIAAARRPAVLLPEPRPHDEQGSTARALAAAGLATVLDREPDAAEWPTVLGDAARTDGGRWAAWSTGDGARRAAAVINRVARA